MWKRTEHGLLKDTKNPINYNFMSQPIDSCIFYGNAAHLSVLAYI